MGEIGKVFGKIERMMGREMSENGGFLPIKWEREVSPSNGGGCEGIRGNGVRRNA